MILPQFEGRYFAIRKMDRVLCLPQSTRGAGLDPVGWGGRVTVHGN